MRKKRAMINGEKSKTLIGQIIETSPKTSVVVIITDPITSPIISQS